MDANTARQKLKDLRRSEARQPEDVRKWADVALKSRSSLGDEVWVVLEQDIMAALDMHDYARATKHYKEIEQRFGDGNRVKLLEGMICEAKEDWAGAERIYQELKEKDECLQAPRKRLVAMNKARNRLDAAAFQLVEYLDVWMTEPEPWLELADLYLSMEQHKHAAHCFEELILLQPYHYAHHLNFAEVMLTIGGAEATEVARMHYQQSLELKPDCVRAVYGLWQCAAVLGGSSKSGKEGKVQMQKLMNYARSKLDVAYTKAFDKGDTMSRCMDSLQSAVN